MSRQMNVPIRPKNDQQVQTDVNLIQYGRRPELQALSPYRESHFLQQINQSFLAPFSDYYLLSQLHQIVQQLKNNLPGTQEFQTKRIIHELSKKIYGLLARQCKVKGINGESTDYEYYIMEKQKQLLKLQIIYGNYDKKLNSYMTRIMELEREIFNLRNTLKIYQSAAQQNQLYKGFFKQFKEISVNARKITDFDRLLNDQILPKIKQFQINLADLSKTTSRERSSKQKAAISRYALELDNLSKARQVSWEALSNSAAAFFTSIEHLNNDDWVQQRISINDAYNQLRTRHTALLSLVSKNVQQLISKDTGFRRLSEINSLISLLQKQNKQGFETMIVNGWIGLGVIHCHRQSGVINEDISKLRSLIVLFQTQFKKLRDRYPQLDENISVQLKEFLKFQISRQFEEGGALNWLRQILVKQTQVVHVDNVYNYYSKNDKDQIFYLRVLVKSLLDELKRIANGHKIDLQLDQGVLQLLRAQKLDGLNIEDVIALFRPSRRICQADVYVQKPVVVTNVQSIGVPLNKQKAVIVSDVSHQAVNLHQGVPYRVQIPYQYSKTQVIQVPTIVQKPYAVATKVTENIIVRQSVSIPQKVCVPQHHYVQVIKQVLVRQTEKVPFVQKQQVIITQPHQTIQQKPVYIQVIKEVNKPVFKQINKIFKVEQAVPKVYKQPKFEIVERPVHHVITQKQIQFVNVEKPIIQRHQIAKPIEIKVDKPIYYPEHCDCQKPQAISMEVQKAVYVEIPKQIVVQKCHFVQPNVQQRIVEVPCHSQIPIFKQVLKEQPIFIDKIVPLHIYQQKLVITNREVPFFIQHFVPVQLMIQKPVIIRDIKHVPVQVQQPVPIYIQKIVPKIVEVFKDKIVQKIVEVPKVVIVEKIVEKIVPVPRVVQVIVPTIQEVQVPIFIETPYLEIVQLPVQKLVVDIQERQRIVEVSRQILKVQKVPQVFNVVQKQQVKKVIEVLPDPIPQIVVEKLVEVIVEKPVEVHVDRIAEKVISVNTIIPVEQRVQVPLQIQCPVPIIQNVPIFYKQPVIQIDVQRVQRQVLVQVQRQVIQIKQVEVPFIVKQKEIVQLPGQTIILKEPELHIIQIERQNVVTCKDVQDKPIQQYLDIQKAHVVCQQKLITPSDKINYFEKTVPVSMQRPIHLIQQHLVVVQRPDTCLVNVPKQVISETVKIVTNQTLVVQKSEVPSTIQIPKNIYHVLYQQLPPKQYQKQVLRTDKQLQARQVHTVEQVLAPNRQIITKVIQVPVYMQKIFEKILMLPQIVQVEKKVYMVEEINNLIAKQVDLQTHQQQYRVHVQSIQNIANQLVNQLRNQRQGNMVDLRNKLNQFIKLLRTQSRIPKIVQTIKQVQVVRQRDRPVLVPVYDQTADRVLLCIISQLVEGIKGLSRVEIQKRFPERLRNIFAFQFGLLDGAQGSASGVTGALGSPRSKGGSTEVMQRSQSKWKSWLESYQKNLPNTLPENYLSEAENAFLIDFNTEQMDYATLRASIQRLILMHQQRIHEIEIFKRQYRQKNESLNVRINELNKVLSTQRYYKDLYRNQLLKIQKLLELGQYDSLKPVIETITTIRQEISSKIIVSGQYETVRQPSSEIRSINTQENERRYSQVLGQLQDYQKQSHERSRQLKELQQENDRLRFQIDQVRLSIPAKNKETSDENFRRYNEQWEDRLRTLEQNHMMELNHLRQQLIQRATDGSSQGSDEFSRAYNQLMKKYNQLSSAQKSSQDAKRNIINSYQDRLRDLNKQLLTIKRQSETRQKKGESDRKGLIDDYERKMKTAVNNQEKQLRRQIDTLKRNYQNLQQRSESDRKKLISEYQNRLSSTSSNQQRQLRKELQQSRRQLEQRRRFSQSTELRYQNEKKRLIEEYQAKLVSSSSSQDRQLLRNQIETLRRQGDTLRRNLQQAQEKCNKQKKKIIDDYERKLTNAASSNQEKQLRRQLQTVRRNYDTLVSSSQNEKKRITEDYQTKLRSVGSSQQREVRRQLETLKKNYETFQKNTESQKSKLIEQYERRIKQIQDDLDRAKTTKKGTTTSPEQLEQLSLLKQKIKKLEVELESSKKQIQSYQKSRLGQTTYTSGLKQSGLQAEFQSPQTRYKSTGAKYQQGQGSGISKQQQPAIGRSTQPEKGRISRSGVRGERLKVQEGQQIKSVSSRVSGGSESRFKTSMTMKQFIDQKKGEDKDLIIQKIQEEADKGIINSYSPSNIYLSNFNPNNIQGLIVRFGAPITNKKNKNDGLYLAPEILRGQTNTTLKSVVFTLGVIWDEIIHYESYYKTIADIENPAYQYKVRDTSLNPILRNTLFEMMSKEPAKRIQLGEAKRRLSLQRYIVSEGKAGTATSRVSSQSRKNL